MFRFNCPTCKSHVELTTVRDVRHHLNVHKAFGKLNFPIRCLQSDKCYSTLSTIDSFIKHLDKYHYAGDFAPFPPENAPCFLNPLPVGRDIENEGQRYENAMEVEGDGDDPQSRLSFREKTTLLKEKMKTEALNMIVEIRARGNIPFKVSVDILRLVANFVDLIINDTAEAIESEFKMVANLETVMEKTVSIKDNLMTLKGVIHNLSTEYRIRKIYDTHPHFVRPEPLVLGYRFETELTKSGGESTIKIVNRPNVAQYCSISKTLKNLLSDPEFFRAVFPSFPHVCSHQDEITCFLDSIRGKEMLSKTVNQRTVFLQVFFMAWDLRVIIKAPVPYTIAECFILQF